MTDPRMTPTNDAPVTVEPDWLNADTCIENMRIAYDDATEDEDETPVDTVVSAGDLGVLIGLAEYALRHRLAALASAPACAASPDHADIMETIANAGDDWQKQGYSSALAEVRDMANVGRSLLERIADHSSEGPLKGWHPADCPTEVVCDLLNMLADASALAGDGVERAKAIAEGMVEAFDKLASSTKYDTVDRERWAASRDDAAEIAAALARPSAAVGEREA